MTELNELGEFLGGGTPSSSNEDFWRGSIPWISSSDLSEGNINSVNISRFITEDAISNSATKLCSGPVIIIVSRVGVGKVAYSEKSLCTSQDFLNIINFKCNGIFLSYLLSTEMKKAASAVQGTSIKGISSAEIKSKKLFISKENEQQKIASILSLIDERIATQNKIIEQLETLIQDLRNQIFKQKIRFKDKDGNEFPEWKIFKLNDIAERIVQKNLENNQNVLTISAQFGLISQLEFFSKSVSAKDVSGYYRLRQNDFAYNKSYSNGYPMGAIKRLKRYEKGIVSTLYICFRLNETVSVDFMEQYFESGIQNIEIEKIAQEGARNHGLLNVGVSDFFNIEINLPSLEEQKRIASFLTKVDQKIQTEISILKQLEIQRKYLLRQMFV